MSEQKDWATVSDYEFKQDLERRMQPESAPWKTIEELRADEKAERDARTKGAYAMSDEEFNESLRRRGVTAGLRGLS